jgi:hypothetical protein
MSENPQFDNGRRYVVGGRHMIANEREGVGLSGDGPVVYRPLDCGALVYAEAEKQGLVSQLGVGRSPEQ